MCPAPKIDEKTLKEMRKILRKKTPTTVEALMERLGISRSTVYRYFRRLEADGEVVSMIGIARPTKFTILDC